SAESLPVHPTQLYEALVALLLCAIAVVVGRTAWARARDGRLFEVVIAGYALSRLAVENLRGDAGRGLWGAWSSAQLVAVAVLAAMAVLAVWRRRQAAGAAGAAKAAAAGVVAAALVCGGAGRAEAQKADARHKAAGAGQVVAQGQGQPQQPYPPGQP